MGNSQAKESRGLSGSYSRHDSEGQLSNSGRESSHTAEPSSRPPRPRRGSRPDFSSFLGIGGSGQEQDNMTLEQRREAKLEREARRSEKEKQSRLKERERSMKEEHVDGGYLVTQGVYVGVEDYNKPMVRQLMVERRLAPFWRGLNDFSESWAEHQLMAAARGMPIPPADHVPPELEYSLTKRVSPDGSKDKIKGMTIPIGSRSQSFQSEQSAWLAPQNSSLPASSMLQPATPSPPAGPLFRARARTLASLTSSKTNDPKEMIPREFQLPPDPFVNGQPIEVYLYKDASECPICFLYYPPYLNTTRCCEQPICSECFVQIKRPEPHAPEHEQPDPNAPPVSEEERQAQAEGLLVSEVATCPYCKQPEFGITYSPPPFRRGLTYGTGSQPYQVMSAMSSQTSIASGQMSPGQGRRRGISLSATAPEVVTTDRVRPDWATKLSAARAHAARRSAAATALHAAAYLMNGQTERPAFPGFGRRNVLRRSHLEGEERAIQASRDLEALREAGVFLPPPRGSSNRRNRIDDLEEMMLSEAIRLSIAAEEERAKKEERDTKKKAKKEEKESKKADKTSQKATLSANSSEIGIMDGLESGRSLSNISLSLAAEGVADKGKGVERPASLAESSSVSLRLPDTAPTDNVSESQSAAMAIPAGPEAIRRSHLRQMSNASSASSSYVDPGSSFPGSSTPNGNAGLEPMFNFRSLTAMITEDEKGDGAAHVEDTKDGKGQQGSFEHLSGQPSPSSQNSSTADDDASKSSSLLAKDVGMPLGQHGGKENGTTQSPS